MQSLGRWFTELDEVYARHAGRHGPSRLLPAEVLPAHGRVPGHAAAGGHAPLLEEVVDGATAGPVREGMGPVRPQGTEARR